MELIRTGSPPSVTKSKLKRLSQEHEDEPAPAPAPRRANAGTRASPRAPQPHALAPTGTATPHATRDGTDEAHRTSVDSHDTRVHTHEHRIKRWSPYMRRVKSCVHAARAYPDPHEREDRPAKTE